VQAITFQAWRGGVYHGLADVLEALGPYVDGYTWRWKVDEAIGPSTPILEATDVRTMTTRELAALTGPDTQVVDGEFAGFLDRAAETPTVIIRAFDSTSWDVYSDDDQLLEELRRRYADSRPLEE
jgi:hypothetical protein